MRMTTQDDVRRLAYVAALTALILVIAGARLAHGQDTGPYHFNLYSADRGTGESAMRFKVQLSGLDSLGSCYAVAAISIDALRYLHPDKDFMGGCQNGELLTLLEISKRALALLPKGEDR